MTVAASVTRKKQSTFVSFALVLLAALVFSALFAVVNAANYRWLSPLFERQTDPTVWGIIQRLFLIIPAAAVAAWRPRALGFQVGKSIQYWRMLAIMLLLNVGVVGAYLLISGGTPYSGFSMLINEVVTVPLVEEVVWRGIVFAAALAILQRMQPDASAAATGLWAAIISGLCFGLLHATNALYGYPLPFVVLQTLNASIWGVMYGVARAKTGSLYPPILLHAAMNLVVVLV